jgi:hypothetical protein
MLPAFADDDDGDGALVDTEASGQSLLGEFSRGVQLADSANVTVSEFGHAVSHSGMAWVGRTLTPLNNRVHVVVSWRACEKVGGVAAWRVVAVVAYDFPKMPDAGHNEKGQSVGAVAASANVKSTIASRLFLPTASEPRPAFVSGALLHKRPEAFDVFCREGRGGEFGDWHEPSPSDGTLKGKVGQAAKVAAFRVYGPSLTALYAGNI